MKKILLFGLLFTLSLGLRGQIPGLANKIDSIVNISVTRSTPGCVVGVLKDGKILYKQMYGMSNLDYRIQITDSTLFNLASVSKQFTAYLVLLLEKEGKLSLDDTIQKYIPELKNYGHPVTIRQLLHHTSGIPSTDNVRLFAGLSLESQWDAEDEMAMIASYQKLNFKPGEEHVYSNAGYFLLTRIIEKITGMSFARCMAEKVFIPFNMKTAAIYDNQGKVIHNRASGYKKAGDDFIEANTSGESIYGSTNLYASVNDMINWSIRLTSNSPEEKQLSDRLFNPSDKFNKGDTINYTYGFYIWKHKGLKIADHGGFTMGFKTHITFVPVAGFTVFVLSNNENTDPKDIAMKIVDLSLNDILKPELQKDHNEITINKELNQLYKGSYIFPDGMVLKFEDTNDTLKLIIPGAPKFVMHPEKENEFFIKDFDAQCTFIRDNNGKVNEIIWHQNNQNPKGVRYSEPKPLSTKELEAYTGRFEIPELNVTYPVSLTDNDLNITLPKTFRMVNIDTNLKIKHVSGDTFYGSLGLIEFKRNKEGKVKGFVIADIGRIRNIEFEKRGISYQ